MKRLSDNAIEIVNELHTERLAYESEYVPIIDALNRLAQYEDIGLEPEKIVFLKNVAELLGSQVWCNEFGERENNG